MNSDARRVCWFLALALMLGLAPPSQGQSVYGGSLVVPPDPVAYPQSRPRVDGGIGGLRTGARGSEPAYGRPRSVRSPAVHSKKGPGGASKRATTRR